MYPLGGIGCRLKMQYRALNRDPEIYGEDAHLFEPSRHLDKDGQLKVVFAETKDEGHYTFGFGRRYVFPAA